MSKSGYKRNYIVVKLWATILLLVTVVLFILSLLLMQFFRSYIMEDVKDTLTNTASKIAVTLEQHTNLQFGLEVAREILDDNTRVVIVTDKEHVYYSNESDADYFNIDYFQNDPKLSKVFTKHQNVSKELDLSKDKEQVEPGLMIGVPLSVNNTEGAVFIYQSLDVMNEAIRVTTRIILWSALIAFVLTTFFALFLSTRVTAPLRKMRESASEVAKGRFDVKVPILTHDEIGELAKTFNQMRRQLKINMTALKQEKEQLSSILKSMADGVITINKKGEILVTNPPAERFLKTWALANKQKNDPSEVPPKIFEQLSKAIETEKEQSGEITFQNTYWSFIVSPQFDDETIRGAVVVLRDMTEERKLEKLREDFIANVSHELRTPIAMLQGYSEALMDDVASSEEERREIASIINEESLRMGRLVNELLDLARLESGHMRLYEDTVEIKPFIERIGRKFSGIAKENNVRLEVTINNENEFCYFDQDRIEQVLTNLIDNAIRHTSNGGYVHITVNSNDEKLEIIVQDNGSGIPSEDLPFVFERFYKADKARTRGRAGTGLGLAIAKNIIDAHNGAISVSSEVGKGTTFTIHLPVNDNIKQDKL